jgi:D-threo-aldose 1-dehydrogenase
MTGRPPTGAPGQGITRHRLGTTPVEVTSLGYGAAPAGNLFRSTTDAETRAAVDAAWDAGIRYFDTAPLYGLGLSERRTGAALRDRPRDGYVVSTKVGRVLEARPGPPDGRFDPFDVPADHHVRWDFTRDGILRSVEDSLARTGLDRIDVVYLHDPDDHAEAAFREGYPALVKLRSEGVVGAIGAGMNQAEMLADFARNTDMDLLMLAGRYTLLEQAALDDLLPTCEARGVRVVAAGVFNSGLLARDAPPDDAKYDYGDAPAELVARARRIAAVCERHGVRLPAAALAFPRAHPAVASVCVGARSPAQMRRNAELFDAEIPPDLWAELRAERLLREDAPVP